MKKKLFQYFKRSPNFSWKWEHYFEIYENLFNKYVNKKIVFVEVGVADGGSLHMWRSYLGKKARIIGIDLNPNAKKLEKYGFEIFIGDQSTKTFWENFYKKVGKIDILLDDGGHKSIQQITSVVESIKYIKNEGMILVEDTCSSFMNDKAFRIHKKYSFINFCNLIIEGIHRRNPLVNSKKNLFSNKIHSICFYESLTQINISNKLKDSKHTGNKPKNPVYYVDFRNRGYFIKTLNIYKKFFGSLNENTVTFKFLRKIFHRNLFFYLHEKMKLKRYFNFFKR